MPLGGSQGNAVRGASAEAALVSRRGAPLMPSARVLAALLVLLVGVVGALLAHAWWAVWPVSTPAMSSIWLDKSYPFADWMGDYWSEISEKPLWQVTLPGTHNSGNTLELTAETLYRPDVNYAQYAKFARSRGLQPLDEAEFHSRFLPWNINHHANVVEQLRHGIRWFHLKVCNMNASSEAPALDGVRHCHRGYTATSLAAIVGAISQFLLSHPLEFAVLGLNNLYGFDDAQRHALARQLEAAFSGERLYLATAHELRHVSVAHLARERKRVAVFMPDPGSGVGRVTDSNVFLSENWGPAGDSGDLAAYTDWMVQDIRTHALQDDRFYVVQANPNNNDTAAFLSLHAQPPVTLYSFEYDFLRSLAPTVLSTIRTMPAGPRINAISTDFMHEARVTELALAINFGRRCPNT